MKRLLFGWCLLLAIWAVPAPAQVVFDDVKGRTAFLVPLGSVVGVNTGEASVELGYYQLLSNQVLFGGASVQAASKDGVGPVFGAGDLRPGAAVDGVLGLKTGKNSFIALHGKRDWYQTALADLATPEEPVRKEVEEGWEAGGHFSAMLSRRFGFAVAVGRRTANNYTDLDKVTVRTVTSVRNAGGDIVEIVETAEARQGVFRQDKVDFVDVDALFVVARGVSVRPFGRFLPNRAEGGIARNYGGLDVALFQNDPLFQRRLGLVLQIDEKLPGEDKELKDRVRVSFVANLAPLAGKLFDALR
jgi:hypothetical protein